MNQYNFELNLSERLVIFLRRCETICTPKCCGVDAYNFSVMHIASIFDANEKDYENYIKDFNELLVQIQNNPSIVDFSVSIEGAHTKRVSGFTLNRADFVKLIERIIYNIPNAIKVLKYSNSLELEEYQQDEYPYI